MNYPRIGIGVIVLRDNRVLLGERIGAHGAGTWALPGGHLEFAETPADCARREVWEETGLIIDLVTEGPFTSDVFVAEEKHYVTLFLVGHSNAGDPQRCEPDRCLRWAWFEWSNFPEPLFQPLATLRATGFDPSR